MQLTFDIFNNLVYLEYSKKNYPGGKKYLQDLRGILEETEPIDNGKRKIYVYKLLINYLLYQGINTE